MNTLGLHVNAWLGGASDDVAVAGCHLKVLNTALDFGKIADWRARNPDALLVYREVFPDGSDERDTIGRTDRLARNAERLLPYGVIVETPWNEQMQARDLLALHRDLTCHSVMLLRSRGFDRIAVGHFSVQWPRVADLSLFLPAIHAADYYSCHTYGAPNIWDDWERNVGHALAVAEIVKAQTGRDTLLTEFGIDRGVLGENLAGYRASGLTASQYADQLRWAGHRLPACVRAAFVFCCGQFGDWASFDVAGERPIRDLLNERWGLPVDFVLGFKSFADALRARGIDPGIPEHAEAPAINAYEVVTTQRTTTGEMLWVKGLNRMLFVRTSDGTVVAYRDGNLRVA